MEGTLKEGNLVFLDNYKYPLTVVEIKDSRNIECWWFVESTLMKDVFKKKHLRRSRFKNR